MKKSMEIRICDSQLLVLYFFPKEKPEVQKYQPSFPPCPVKEYDGMLSVGQTHSIENYLMEYFNTSIG